MDGDLEFNTSIFKETIMFFIPGYTQRLVLVTRLVIISIFPKNADTNKVLAKFISTSQMGACEKT